MFARRQFADACYRRMLAVVMAGWGAQVDCLMEEAQKSGERKSLSTDARAGSLAAGWQRACPSFLPSFSGLT